MTQFTIRVSSECDLVYAELILETTRAAAIERGSGIGGRSIEQISNILANGRAVIAITNGGEWAGFCFINPYENGKVVSHSGMIVHPSYRRHGLSKKIKQSIIELTQQLYPGAAMISITTTGAVMKMNHTFGFQPVPFESLTADSLFWSGCKGCVNFSILEEKGFQNCFCTAMKRK